jgi:hypothetical protein
MKKHSYNKTLITAIILILVTGSIFWGYSNSVNNQLTNENTDPITFSNINQIEIKTKNIPGRPSALGLFILKQDYPSLLIAGENVFQLNDTVKYSYARDEHLMDEINTYFNANQFPSETDFTIKDEVFGGINELVITAQDSEPYSILYDPTALQSNPFSGEKYQQYEHFLKNYNWLINRISKLPVNKLYTDSIDIQVIKNGRTDPKLPKIPNEILSTVTFQTVVDKDHKLQDFLSSTSSFRDENNEECVVYYLPRIRNQ